MLTYDTQMGGSYNYMVRTVLLVCMIDADIVISVVCDV